MKRYGGAFVIAGALTGCINVDHGVETGGSRPNWGKSQGPVGVPGVEGPYGSKVPMAAPYNTAPPGNAYTAQQMMSRSRPLGMAQMNGQGGMMPGGPPGSMMPPTMAPRGGLMSPPGIPGMPGMPGGMPGGPGMPGMPGPGGPGGVAQANQPPGGGPGGGVRQTQFAGAPGPVAPIAALRTQVRFLRPTGMKVQWFTNQGPDGKGTYSDTPLETPGRYNFAQGAIYRLKLTNIEGRPGVPLYPTLEVVPANPKTAEFLAHGSVPIEFTADDFKQIAENNYVVKVIYLPDPQFQDVAGAGVDQILSTQLEPGQNPIDEALKRGSILLVIRMGNVDQEAPNTPALNGPGPQAGPPPGFQFAPGGPVPPNQVPFYHNPPAPGFAPPGAFPPGAFPPGAIPPGMVPPGATPPGGVAPPGPLPPLPGAPLNPPTPGKDVKTPAAPPSFNIPSLPTTPPAGGGAKTTNVVPPPPLPGLSPLTPDKGPALNVVPPLPAIKSGVSDAGKTPASSIVTPASSATTVKTPDSLQVPTFPAIPATLPSIETPRTATPSAMPPLPAIPGLDSNQVIPPGTPLVPLPGDLGGTSSVPALPPLPGLTPPALPR